MVNLFKTISYLKISTLSLRANRLRSFLSIIGVVFGVMAVIVIIAVGEGAKAEALRQIERLGTKNIYVKSVLLSEEKKQQSTGTHDWRLSVEDRDRIAAGCPYVAATATLKEIPVSVVGAFTEMTPPIISCTPSYFDILTLNLRSGRHFTDRDITSHHQVCVIGDQVSARLGAGGAVGGQIRVGSHLFKIIGILCRHDVASPTGAALSVRNYNEMILIPAGSEKWLLAAGENRPDHLTELIIAIDTTENVPPASAIIKKILAVNHKDIEGYQVVTPLELLRQAKKTNELFNLLLFGIASISLLVGGIGIMNIMLATVSERRREIGIRRAVGAKQKHILVQFLTEAALLTLIGGIVGIAAGLITIFIMKLVAPWELVVTAEAVFLPLLIASLTGIFFGSYPAWKAAQEDPITALRG